MLTPIRSPIRPTIRPPIRPSIRNMKKLIISIIGIVTIFVFQFSIFNVVAEAEAEKSKIADECGLYDLKFEYPSDEDFDDLVFRIAFEKARTQYHDVVKCVFDKSVISILSSAGDDLDTATLTAGAPNFPNLLKPDVACLDEKPLANLLKDSSPENLLQPLLSAYNKYTDYLNRLIVTTSVSSSDNQSQIRDFAKVVNKLNTFQNMVENEIQNSLVALDTAFISLKEMRQAFMMHVHFQCMLKNLEDYRRVLGSLRTVVSIIPGVIEDCSMHK